MKEYINVFDYSNTIFKALKTGVLLTTKADGKVNSMTISWGQIGIEWNKEIFSIFVRENRYTKELLDKNPEFTINIPLNNIDKKILGYCGVKSGKDTDKIKNLNLTLIESDEINVPGIKELPLTLECKVIYKQEQNKNSITKENIEKFYPENVTNAPGENKFYHTTYFGEILRAYIIKD